jgi:predicted transporter
MKDRSTVQSAALLAGIVFLVVGILGFVPGVTTRYGDLSFAGHGSGAKLLGIFQTSILHNIVHLLFGLVGIAMARSWEGARTFLIGGGVVYLVLFVYGLLAHGDSSANFIPVNSADNVLHVALGVAMIALGVVLGRELIPTDRTANRA